MEEFYRIRRLPPYVFEEVNKAKAKARAAGADIVDLEDPDLLQPPLDRSFKKPGGYVMREKLAAAREAAGQEKPKARSR